MITKYKIKQLRNDGWTTKDIEDILTMIEASFDNNGKLPAGSRGCEVEGCENVHKENGYCDGHQSQMDRCGKIINKNIRPKLKKNSYLVCTIENCTSVHFSKGMCKSHYQKDYNQNKRNRNTGVVVTSDDL